MKSLPLSILVWAIALLITINGLVAPPTYSAALMTVSTIAQTVPQEVKPQEPSGRPSDPQEEATTDEIQQGDRSSNHSATDPNANNSKANAAPPSAGPYDMDSIQEFNRALYGS